MPTSRRHLSSRLALHPRHARAHRLLDESSSSNSSNSSSDLCTNGTSTSTIELEGFDQVCWIVSLHFTVVLYVIYHRRSTSGTGSR